MQTTLKSSVSFSGVGLHSGKAAHATVRPAAAGHGISFVRTDIDLGDAVIPARWDLVDPTPLCTRLVNGSGVSVSTVEHIMAALAGCGVHNAVIEIDGPEIPILDGSAAHFVHGIMKKGVRDLGVPLQVIEVLKPVTVEAGGARATLRPARELTIEFHIDFADAAIGRQDKTLAMPNGAFVRELCDSRTFCRRSDIETMWEHGLARGGTLENAVVVDGDEVLSPGGFRHADEAVRHKMLDAVGDLALAGAPILGHYTGERAGHTLTNALLRALFNTPGAFRLVTCDAATRARLPGKGLVASEIPQVA